MQRMSETLAVTNEIVRLHDFFQDWFNGARNHLIDEFADALDDAFFIVSPRGTVSDKDSIVAAVRGHANTGPIEIRVEHVEVRASGELGLVIATYEEHQERQVESAVLVSTVGLIADPSCPGGYRWYFVHETFYEATPSSR